MSRSLWLLPLCGWLIVGCSGPQAQLASCQQDKEQLLTTIRAQRDANRSLEQQVASLESRLDESEKELARLGKPGARMSSRPVEQIPLPWRSPGNGQGPAEVRPPAEMRKTSSRSEGERSLAELARDNQRLRVDPQGETASLAAQIEFEDDGVQLTAAARRELDQVARWLKSEQARRLQVLVAGRASGRLPQSGEGAAGSARQLAAARAQAVADYLDSHGIAEERLAVTGTGSRVVAAGGPINDPAAGVQILVAEPNAAVAAWRGGGALR